MSIFEEWWLPIEAAVNDKIPLSFGQNLYKEIYMNIIKDDRWANYLNGLWVTLKVSFFAILVGTLLGTLLAVLRLPEVTDLRYKGKNPLRKIGVAIVHFFSWFAKFYIDLIRGTPLLLQVLIINFGIFGTVKIDKVIIGVIACGLNSAAYVAEIVRGGLISVDKGQTEAGRSLGLSGPSTMVNIILPQAAKSALPALCNEFIALIKETSILSYIALTELTKAGDYIRSRTYSAFTPYIVSGLLYLLVTIVLTKLIGRLERRLANSDH
ncbi:MAG: amino acid ABC transporter permease [Clostridia bacterium]|nr:amino acid ABC transporter permease [Clostridia bacterium]